MADRQTTQTTLPIKEMFLARKVEGLIHEKISPTCYVDHKTGKYYRADDSNMVLEDDAYTSRGGANETEHGYTSGTYTIGSYGLEEYIDPDVYEDADEPIGSQGEQDCLMNIKDKLMLRKEKKLADMLFNASNYPGQTSALTGDQRWDDPDSDPTDQFILAIETIKTASGFKPNSFIIGYEAALRLQYNPALGSILGSNEQKIVNAAVLGRLFQQMGLNIPEENIYIGEAQYKTVKTGTANYIWGKDALFAYIDKKSTTRRDDTLTKTFAYKKNRKDEIGTFTPAKPTIKGRWAYAIMHYGHTLVNYKCGYLFKTVVS
jgi:hypothetical protein